VIPVGLYDLQPNVRPVGAAYRELIHEWRAVLPTQSVVLSLPAFPPSRQDDPLVRDVAEHARRSTQSPPDVDAPAHRVESPAQSSGGAAIRSAMPPPVD
jgi:hypothetical protein